MDSIELRIAAWAAWAPGLDSQAAWLKWLSVPTEIPADASSSPPLTEVPAMARRRIEPLGRLALQVAFMAQQGLSDEHIAAMPLVFCSRWGELARSVAMQQELAKGSALSPTAFSHSVHNAIAAQYSIQRRIYANVSAVAGGPFSMEAAWSEAAGLIADGAPEVMCVVFEAPVPSFYAELLPAAHFQFPRAVALRLAPAAPGDGIALRSASAHAEQLDPQLPPDLATLRYLLGEAPSFSHAKSGRAWSWSRKHGR